MLSRNPQEKDVAQVKGVQSKVDQFDTTRRAMKLGEAEATYQRTGDSAPFKEVSGQIKEKTLGGSTENYRVTQTVDNVKDSETSRVIKSAQENYNANPNENTAQELKTAISSGNERFAPQSVKGIDLATALRGVGSAESDRKLADIESNWKNNPEQYKDSYKNELNNQINFYGQNSKESVVLREKMRKADEESLLYNVRNTSLAYDLDPEANFNQYHDAYQRLATFYGSSADGYYATKALNKMSDTEQERLDDEASIEFKTGKIGYDGYKSFLDANLVKFPEGSDQYMKYYKASADLTFQKKLDDMVRSQYNTAPGQVLNSMKSYQGQLGVGSDAYQTVQDQIDKLDQTLRYDAYKEVVKAEIKKRQESINELKVKQYTLENDYLTGSVSDSKYKKKYKEYANKIDYLSDSNTLPEYQIWNTYGVTS